MFIYKNNTGLWNVRSRIDLKFLWFIAWTVKVQIMNKSLISFKNIIDFNKHYQLTDFSYG